MADIIREVSSKYKKRIANLPRRDARPTPAKRAQVCPGCEVCDGNGLVYANVDTTHELFGVAIPCPNAPQELQRTPGLHGLEWDEERRLDWGAIKAINNAQQVAAQVRQVLESDTGSWVYLWGGYGKAKSLVLKIAAAEALRNRGQARYTTLAALLQDLRNSLDSDQRGHRLPDRIRHWQTVPLLCVDEFDKAKRTEWVDEQVFSIFDRRWDAVDFGRPLFTLIASNEPPTTLDGYLQSRVMDTRNKVVEMTGLDVRRVPR